MSSMSSRQNTPSNPESFSVDDAMSPPRRRCPRSSSISAIAATSNGATSPLSTARPQPKSRYRRLRGGDDDDAYSWTDDVTDSASGDVILLAPHDADVVGLGRIVMISGGDVIKADPEVDVQSKGDDDNEGEADDSGV